MNLVGWLMNFLVVFFGGLGSLSRGVGVVDL